MNSKSLSTTGSIDPAVRLEAEWTAAGAGPVRDSGHSDRRDGAPGPSGQYAVDTWRLPLELARGYGRLAICAGVVLGLAVPDLAAALSPLLPYFLITLLVVSLVDVETPALRAQLRRTSLIASLALCLLVLAPVIMALEARVVLTEYGLPEAIAEGLILVTLAPPLLAAPTIARLLDLDSTLALVITLVAHVITPVTISVLAYELLGSGLHISVIDLMGRLAIIVGAGFAIGLTLRRFRMPKPLRRHRGAMLQVLSVLSLTLMAIALSDGIPAVVAADPRFAITAIVCGILLNPLLQFLGAVLFARFGYITSLTVGLLAGYRNVGLLIAALAGSADAHLVAFLAIVQISTFFMPMLSMPVLRSVKRIGFDER